jgi:molybdate transport system regulatory protein
MVSQESTITPKIPHHLFIDRHIPIIYNGSKVRGFLMKMVYKVWLDSDGKAFGDGPHQLLSLVDKVGSLHKAAGEMKMSYRKAWLMINSMENRLGFALLTRQAGGVDGGGSQLTEKAKEFLDRYDAFHREVDEALKNIYCKHFPDQP